MTEERFPTWSDLLALAQSAEPEKRHRGITKAQGRVEALLKILGCYETDEAGKLETFMPTVRRVAAAIGHPDSDLIAAIRLRNALLHPAPAGHPPKDSIPVCIAAVTAFQSFANTILIVVRQHVDDDEKLVQRDGDFHLAQPLRELFRRYGIQYHNYDAVFESVAQLHSIALTGLVADCMEIIDGRSNAARAQLRNLWTLIYTAVRLKRVQLAVEAISESDHADPVASRNAARGIRYCCITKDPQRWPLPKEHRRKHFAGYVEQLRPFIQAHLRAILANEEQGLVLGDFRRDTLEELLMWTV